MASSGSSAGSYFPKWQIAAIGLGTAGVIGIGYWYLKSGKSRRATMQDAKSLSLDEAGDEVSGEQTPFLQAQRFKKEGNVFFKNGKYDEAIDLYSKAIEVCPEEHKTDLATFYQNRAAAYEQLRKWNSVIADCTKAIEFNPRYEKALMRRAKAEEVIKDWENCLDDVTCVCMLQSFTNNNALMMADRVLKELGKKHAVEAMESRIPTIPSQNFIKTYFASFSEDPVYNKLIEVDEPLGIGELKGFLKAKLAFATGRYDEIVPACTEEINSSESELNFLLEALSLRASFNFLMGAFDDALQDLTSIIETENADVKLKVNSLLKRASISMQTEKFQDCLSDFDEAARIGPHISDVFHHRGQVKLLLDKTDEARADFQKSVDLNPDFSIACAQKCYSDYRYALQNKNQVLLDESLSNFKKACEKFPSCTETYVLYAQVLTERKDFEEAEQMYDKALEREPNFASVLVHKGLLYLQWRGDINKGIEMMQKAIEIDNKCEYAYETLGTVEVQRGNLLVAIELFEKAIKLARSELEMTHLFSLRDAATSQLKVQTRLGIPPQSLFGTET